MGLFSRRKSRTGASAWSDERWKGLVSSVSKTSEMNCEKFSAAVKSERASAAAHKAAGDDLRAKAAAELALRNRSKVRALARLATLADQLHMRDLKILTLASLQSLPEPARTELVSFIYAAGRLSVQPLSEAVAMIRNIFPDDVDDIKRGKYAWPDFFDTRLYDALTPGPADDDLIHNELLAAVNEYPEYSANSNSNNSNSNINVHLNTSSSYSNVAAANLSSSTTSPENVSVPLSIPASLPPNAGVFHAATPANLQPVKKKYNNNNNTNTKMVAPSLIIPPANPAQHAAKRKSASYNHNNSYSVTNNNMPTPSPPLVGIGAPPRAATLPPNHLLPRPWEQQRDNNIVLDHPSQPRATIPTGWILQQQIPAQPHAAPPPEIITQDQDTTTNIAVEPDHLTTFQDDDEALAQRYRDLRTS